MGQTADGVFDNHHRAVDDDAEVQRAEAHQVGADLVGEHAGEGEQHRSGITIAVISAARMLPRNRNRIAITRIAPSIRFFFTVAMALSTRLVRSYTVTATTPFGSERLICSSLLATAWATVRLFSPISMNTVPSTTSRPFSVAAPRAQFTADVHGCDVLDADRRAVDVGHDDIGDIFGGRHLARCANQ